MRGPSPGFFRGITITSASLIVPSVPGALALSRRLAELRLGVLVRSAAQLSAALEGSFIIKFTATVISTSGPRT